MISSTDAGSFRVTTTVGRALIESNSATCATRASRRHAPCAESRTNACAEREGNAGVRKCHLDTTQRARQRQCVVVTAGAVHAFTNPGANKIAGATGLPIAYNAAADRRSWEHMKDFFEEIFKATK